MAYVNLSSLITIKITYCNRFNEDIFMPTKKVTLAKSRAFSVHLLTASGSIVAFFSLVFASQSQWLSMFVCMALSLIIDGIDGPIARRLNVKSVLPKWSGELLDNIIDYVTYVLIPAFVFYKSNLMNSNLSIIASALIMISSAIYYADTEMKTEENFFKGFPVTWNMLLFVLFVIHPPSCITFTLLVLFSIFSFLPIWFLHPVRVNRLRWFNLPIFLIWSFLCILGIFIYQLNPPTTLKVLLVITSLYILLIGFIMQLFPKLGKSF